MKRKDKHKKFFLSDLVFWLIFVFSLTLGSVAI